MFAFISIFFFTTLCGASLKSSFDLKGKWLVWNSNHSLVMYSNVPGNVHTALLQNGLIGNPYYRFNDADHRWIGLDNWTFSRSFEVPNDLYKRKTILLKCEGIDTISEIFINRKLIGKTDNMFVSYSFPVKKFLVQGENSIEVKFTSAVSFSKFKFDEYKETYGYPILPECPPPVQHGECHVNMIRKEPCSFSWDWGPSFPTQGIWKPISLFGYDIAFIKYLMIKTYQKTTSKSSHRIIQGTVIVKSIVDNKTVNLLVSIKELSYTVKKKVLLTLGEQKLEFKLEVSNKTKIKKWWPRGYGRQYLYTLKVLLMDGSLMELSGKSVRFGFRTVQLVQEPIQGSEGLSFYFKINSIPMFLKGANWIPADSFQDRVNKTVIDSLLQSAADVHMNILRVWGGGIYEQDYFYNRADELGILIWQDMVFACAMYPVDDEFLASVQTEITHQIRRLQHHPSILAWSGNNENEGALRQNWYGTSSRFEQYKEDYIKLYVNTIRNIVKTEDDSRPFIIASPSNGKETEKEGWVAKNPASSLYGDVHYYNYTADCWNPSVFPKPRFASEYGYQSYPSFETLSEIALWDDLHWDSSLMSHRQHHGFGFMIGLPISKVVDKNNEKAAASNAGNIEIFKFIKQHFTLPPNEDPLEYFKGMVYLSQVTQALCIKSETEHYRRLQGNLIEGQGHTMGAMYWQLNDIWQGPSWSSIEYGGKWKILHYYAKNFFAPVIASSYQEKQQLHLYVISDLSTPIEGKLKVTTFSWSYFKPVNKMVIPFNLKRQSSLQVKVISVSDVCEDVKDCFLITEPVAASNSSGPASPVFLTSFSDVVGLSNPKLEIRKSEIKQINDSVLSFTLRAKRPAAFVWFKTSIRGTFSDNGFLLYTQTKEVLFFSSHEVSIQDFYSSLKVFSLYDLYRKQKRGTARQHTHRGRNRHS